MTIILSLIGILFEKEFEAMYVITIILDMLLLDIIL